MINVFPPGNKYLRKSWYMIIWMIWKNFNDEKHLNRNVDGLLTLLLKIKKNQLNMRKNLSQTRQIGMKISSQKLIWYFVSYHHETFALLTTRNVIYKQYIIVWRLKGSKTKAYDLMRVLFKEKHIALNNDYILTYLKTCVNIEFHDFSCGVFVMKAKFCYQ